MTTILIALQDAKGNRFVLKFVSLNFILFISFHYYFWCMSLCTFRWNSTPASQDSIRLFIVDLGLRCRCFGSVNNKPFFNLFLILVHEVIGKYSNFLNVLLGRKEERGGGREREREQANLR